MLPPIIPAPNLHPGYKSGFTYSTWDGPIIANVAIPAVDTIYLYPFLLLKPITFTAGACRVITAGASSSIKTAIWPNVDNRPVGAPLFVDNTGVTTQSSGANVAPAIAGTLQPGFYWAGTKATGTLPVLVSIASVAQWMMYYMGWSTNDIRANAMSFADAYANNMPTFAAGASFTLIGASGVPIVGLTVA